LILESQIDLKPKYQNIGEFLLDFSVTHNSMTVLMDKKINEYQLHSWQDFFNNILRVFYFFQEQKAQKGEHVVFCSENRREMLECELALMSMGLVHVPLFYGYKNTRVNQLLEFTKADYLVVSTEEQLLKVSHSLKFKKILHYEKITDPGLLQRYGKKLVFYKDIQNTVITDSVLKLFKKKKDPINRDDICLMMYTSGTMGFPKGVQLTHGNILSQQEALSQLWDIPRGDRIMAFLPWHHSFGGIFEKYFALYSGTCLVLDDSQGKNIPLLLENWEKIKPNYFFSIPKVFKEIVTQTQIDPKIDTVVFHPGLKFVFTAGAPLESAVAAVFKAKGIPVLEGWGLTETSPCCTLTDGTKKRRPGVVGSAIPGVKVKLAEDGELMIKGPNVMAGYYNNKEANESVFTDDRWFKTGDLGGLINGEVKILTRKDRIFKLANTEKVNPTALENNLLGHCQLIKHALVVGSGMDCVCALLFPNEEGILKNSNRDIAYCTKPQNIKQLAHCLDHCISELNKQLTRRYEKISTFILIDRELDMEKGELTPSMKIMPKTVFDNYKDYVKPLMDSSVKKPEDAIYINVTE
jgi:long-subunit acyl-CoA synthetase (AMP-forming)